MQTLQEGDVVTYKLLPRDIPTEPHKIWRGKVLRLENECILVEMLEPGYAHLSERIFINQVVGVEHVSTAMEQK